MSGFAHQRGAGRHPQQNFGQRSDPWPPPVKPWPSVVTFMAADTSLPPAPAGTHTQTNTLRPAPDG